MAVREMPMIDLHPRALPVIDVHFDVDEEAWVLNCLSCWGEGDIPQFLGQFATRRRAMHFGELHRHWGDMGIGLQAEDPMAWVLCKACNSCFSAWPVHTQPLGGGRTYAVCVLSLDTAEAVRLRAVAVSDPACSVCLWIVNHGDDPIPRSVIDDILAR